MAMIKAQPSIDHPPLLLHLPPIIDMTDDQFFGFCQINRDLRIERTAKGTLIIMPSTGRETGQRNSELNGVLMNWAKQDGDGITFDSSTGFNLPNGATRSPDVAWVRRSRLATLTQEEKRKFIPLCPDFVIELRSPSDCLGDLQEKMQEYIDNGARLGWLIDPDNRQVYVYREDCVVECLENPSDISGEPVLPGFTLDLKEILEPDF